MRVLHWHVHGAWSTAFVHGDHEHLIPVAPDRGPEGRGRAQTYAWPDNAVEVTKEELGDTDVDVVVLQRPEELDGLAREWLGGRVPGKDVPAVYVEHNAPQGRVNDLRHPAADRDDLLLVHVTHFNDLFWDAGSTETTVVDHGIVDPGHRYTGELPRAAVVVNEARRRARVTGTDLLPRLNGTVPLDLFGMDAASAGEHVTPIDDLPHAQLHQEMARRRVYLHPIRWTSLGLALLEAMHLGMPVVALATTEVPMAVPPSAGVVSTDVRELRAGLARLVADRDEARERGTAARAAALERYGLGRFLADWDALLERVAR
ncbi:glycosyltransferase [Conexibacter sp. SYSU D00693]|uniref:glycosyltransferase n=1 Tax=Conexibacter sp. SYSU D00693 TaxID=2812560 RepID=UPI00196B9C1D|nr:glycosyltransferase [Conexibacter sp. SYSU D00693]